MNTQRHEVPDDPTLVLDAESGKWIRPQSTRAIVYPDGRVVKRMEYDSFGRPKRNG